MSVGALIYGLWVASIWLQGFVLAGLIAKKMWRVFPMFSAYSVLTFAANLTLYSIHHQSRAYFVAYWCCEIAGVFFGFAVVYEIFRMLLRGHEALQLVASKVVLWAFLCLVLLALGVAYFQPYGEKAWVIGAILVTEEAARVLEVGLIVFLFLFSKAFGLHWRQSAFGIALGLGVFVSVELIGLAMRLQFGTQAGPVFNSVRAISFNTSLIVWAVYVLLPERITISAELPKAAQLERWNQAIMELIHQ